MLEQHQLTNCELHSNEVPEVYSCPMILTSLKQMLWAHRSIFEIRTEDIRFISTKKCLCLLNWENSYSYMKISVKTWWFPHESTDNLQLWIEERFFWYWLGNKVTRVTCKFCEAHSAYQKFTDEAMSFYFPINTNYSPKGHWSLTWVQLALLL